MIKKIKIKMFLFSLSAIRPELASRPAEYSLPYSDVTIYIFAISHPITGFKDDSACVTT